MTNLFIKFYELVESLSDECKCGKAYSSLHITLYDTNVSLEHLDFCEKQLNDEYINKEISKEDYKISNEILSLLNSLNYFERVGFIYEYHRTPEYFIEDEYK